MNKRDFLFFGKKAKHCYTGEHLFSLFVVSFIDSSCISSQVHIVIQQLKSSSQIRYLIKRQK